MDELLMFEHIYRVVVEYLTVNQFASGAIIAFIFGTVGNYFLKAIPFCKDFIIRKTSTIVEVKDCDNAFQWVNLWASNLKYVDTCKKLQIVDIVLKEKITSMLAPSVGFHWFFYNKRPVFLWKIEEKSEQSERRKLSYYIQFLFSGRKSANKFFETISQTYYSNDKDSIQVTVVDSANGGWNQRRIRKRNLDSCVLPTNTKEFLLNDIDTFLKSEDFYDFHGIPYKKTYLLYGPPGSGKTTLGKTVACHFGKQIKSIRLSNDSTLYLERTILETPDDSVLIIEDIDCANFLHKREDGDGKKNDKLQTFLNALDGVASPRGLITFLTTNHIEKLDEAVIRKGRVDHSIYLGNANDEQAEILFSRFFPNAESYEIAHFVNKFGNENYSMAQLQGYLLENRNINDVLNNDIGKEEFAIND